MRTIIISQNPRKAEYIKKGLKYENLDADIVSSNDTEAVRKFINYYDAAIILDDDFLVTTRLIGFYRESGNTAPLVILATHMTAELAGLKNDTAVKRIYIRPFSFESIASELRFHVFQNNSRIENHKFILRDLELDLSRHEVTIAGEPVQLRHREFALLHFMMLNAGKVLTRNTLLEHVWDRNTNILTNTVDVHISQLRKKLEKEKEHKYIYTIPCTGYLLS